MLSLHLINQTVILNNDSSAPPHQVYLCLPNYRSMTEGHCLIVPMMHVSQATALDEDVWDEIQVMMTSVLLSLWCPLGGVTVSPN